MQSVIGRQFAPEATYSLSGADERGSIKEFTHLPEAERRRIRLLKGHMPYGLHRYLSVPASYITMLRDPVDRIISHYNYVLSSPGHYLHHEVTSREMSLSDYVGSGLSTELTNDQTRLISGVEKVNTRLFDDEERRTLRTGRELVTPEILEIAKKNLRDDFAAVGLFSRFDESLLLFKRRLGWRRIYYVRRNVTKAGASTRRVPLEERDLIAKHNEMDAELYEYARRLFQGAVEEEGAGFGRELRRFERNNRLYARARRGFDLPRRAITRVNALLGKKRGKDQG